MSPITVEAFTLNKNYPYHVMMLITEEWYFRSHRLDLARGLVAIGKSISIGTRRLQGSSDKSILIEPSLELFDVPFRRSLGNPVMDLYLCLVMPLVLWRRKPDVVNTVALKPILLSFLAVFFHPGKKFVHSFAGMGYLFTSSTKKASVLKTVAEFLLRKILSAENSYVVVQNDDDRNFLVSSGLALDEKIRLIPGSGIDTVAFSPIVNHISESETKTIILPARLIKEKGIFEFVSAARAIEARGRSTRFAIVGGIDADNPGALDRKVLESWVEEGIIEWWGHQDNMSKIYQQADIVCLPSYREGLPKVLLEAAACGKPLIATDVPGCRDICLNGRTGILVPPRDDVALAEAIMKLVDNEHLANRYGARARELVVEKMSLQKIVGDFDDFYSEITG